MSDKEEKAKEPLKDVTGKELSEEDLKDVAGGMRKVGITCSCAVDSHSGNIDAGNNPG